MKKPLSYLFVILYLFSLTVTVLPGLNGSLENYEFKKKCKYGRKDKLVHHQEIPSEFTQSADQKIPAKKIVSYCSVDVHQPEEPIHSPIIRINPSYNPYYLISNYNCFPNLHSPPPCFA